MKKYEFLAKLQDRLEGLPPADLRRTLDYYAEMIDDRIEEGLSEEEAVAAIGTPAEIAAQILGDTPFSEASASTKEDTSAKPRKKRPTWEIVLLIAGAPVWVPLLAAAVSIAAAAVAVVLSGYAAIWAAELSIGAAAVTCVLTAPLFAYTSTLWSGLALLGAGLFLVGVSIFLFYGCLHATRGLCRFIKTIYRFIRSRLTRKEA